MTSVALRPAPRGVRSRRRPMRWRKRAHTRGMLISVAGAIGAPVLDGGGRRIGSIEDLLVRVGPTPGHPPLAGVTIRGRHRRTYVRAEEIDDLAPDVLRLRESPLRRPVDRDPSLVALARDVLDRQVVDADGVDVARISDLVLAKGWDSIRLVGSDASARTLLRRLGPRALRRHVAPERLYDWAAVAPYSASAGAVLQLEAPPDRLQPA